MKTYLITGGAGFIGSHLCEILIKRGDYIINIDNFNDFYDPKIKRKNISNIINEKNYQLETGDIRDFESMKKIFQNNSIDFVIHLAAMAGVRPSIARPQLYYDVNVKGTINILELCKEYNVKNFIFASSSSVYGNNEKIPFKESDIVDFSISPYAASKKSGELLLHSYYHLYNIDMAILRFFTVYGPRQRPDLAIHKFTKLIDQGREIPFYGDGSTERDYTYIDDIIDGILRSIDYVEKNKKVYEIFNLGESETISLSTMLLNIEEELDKKAKINKMSKQAGDVEKTFADISKAKKFLGYEPKTEFKVGIKKFVKWYKEMN